VAWFRHLGACPAAWDMLEVAAPETCPVVGGRGGWRLGTEGSASGVGRGKCNRRRRATLIRVKYTDDIW
jgi:hypothetical protein